ncbi:MAG: glycosyltransferase, partial [Candidatus Shapirobacteria bacterium]|nr:glycosyltransferase [Candidatus Shapirobacteria bacterium]
YPIEIITNPQFNHLKRLYGQAKIFWTAAGFGFDEAKEPEKMEHFGITTVEAMAAGCVPIVINKGGQKEIVKEGENGLLWEKETDLIAKTLKLMGDQKEWQTLSKKAQKKSQDFSEKVFYQRIKEIIK